MLIGYDITTIKKFRSGIGYYTEQLLKALLRLVKEDEIILYSNTRESFDELNPNESKQIKKYGSNFCPIRAFWMQFMLPRILKKTKPDFCHFTNYLAPLMTSVPIIVTIHDMTLTMFPKYHYLKKRLLSRPFIPVVAKKAKIIITVSENSKKDIIKHFKINENKIRVIPSGVSEKFRPITNEEELEPVRKKYNIDSKIILYVGNLEPRKNLVRLIEAFHTLVKKYNVNRKLMLVGPKGWGYKNIFKRIKELNIQNEILYIGYVPTEDIHLLYNCADIFAYPSLYEGFGFPILEAFACGIPVLTSNSPSLDETASDAALRVNPTDKKAIADGLLKITQDITFRNTLIEKGKQRAKLFSWDEAAKKTLEVYKEIR